MNFDAQNKIVDPDLFRPVTIIGAGSVGSRLTIMLAREGCADLTVLDGDEVASHNVPMSEFRQKHILRLKVEALSEIVEEASGVQIRVIPKMYNGEPLKTAVVACVDTMEARQLIWKAVKDNPLVGIFVDTRINAEYIEVFAIRTCDKDDVDYYENFIRYSSVEATRSMCGNHGAIHISSTAANVACAALTMFFKQSKFKRHLRMLCGYFQEV
ncbi:MAG: ThiF family adenylyltransferase [bacterium]|nr:ThiF family adenylyltransferase [bacterium]